MRILMVSPYPPIRDGIASYAVQEVAAMVKAGHDVEVLSPWPSAAHHHLALRGPRGPLALAKRVGSYDRVIIQFHPDIFYPLPLTDRDQLLVTAGLVAALARKRNVELRVHEVNFDWGSAPGMFGRLWRLLWRLPVAISVHTAHERDRLAESVGISPDRVAIEDHGKHFMRRTTADKREARARLALDDATFTFVAIGFVQPHKGFDRAVRAFDGLGDHGCRLDIVGSVRVDEPDFLAYAEDLHRLVDPTPGAHFHEGYVSDELFDVWLAAADVLVLPYHFIWTSGVLERAALYDTAVIATRVGGLDDQQRGNVRLVADDDELTAAMYEAAGRDVEPVAAPWPALDADDPDRDAIQSAIRLRAEAIEGTRARAGSESTAGASPRAALERLPALAPVQPGNGRPLARAVKSVVRRVTAWEIDPIVHQVNAVQRATNEALDDERRDSRDSTP